MKESRRTDCQDCGSEQKTFRDEEVELQSCSVETVEKVVKQRAKPVVDGC